MRWFPVFSAVVCVLGSCATKSQAHSQLAARIEALRPRPVLAGAEVSQEVLDSIIYNTVGGALSDPLGDVVMVSGDRAAVRLRDSWTQVADRVCLMAVYSRKGYVGEILVLDAFGDYVLGRFVGSVWQKVEVGDKAAARTPYDAGQHGAAADERPQAGARD
jgi:hypothetical protein